MLNRSGAVGTEALMSVLKNYCRSLNLKTAITVGVIGYPNVGKSSLINSLKRCVLAHVRAGRGTRDGGGRGRAKVDLFDGRQSIAAHILII